MEIYSPQLLQYMHEAEMKKDKQKNSSLNQTEGSRVSCHFSGHFVLKFYRLTATPCHTLHHKTLLKTTEQAKLKTSFSQLLTCCQVVHWELLNWRMQNKYNQGFECYSKLVPVFQIPKERDSQQQSRCVDWLMNTGIQLKEYRSRIRIKLHLDARM